MVLFAACGVATAAGPPIRPVDGEAFFATVLAPAPRGAASAVLSSGGVTRAVQLTGREFRATLGGPVGPRSMTVVFRGHAGRILRTVSSRAAYLLPRSGRVAHPGYRRDIRLERFLAAIAMRHGGVTGIWAQRLWDGRAAGWNAAAEFPAASLVKLPLAVGAIMRMGSRPWRHPSWPDLVAVLRESDDESANRLVDGLGSGCTTSADAMAADGLRRLGAQHSTFTGCYLSESELQPGLPSAGTTSAPAGSNRHTTARDMGRMLYALQAAAVGIPRARRQTGLDTLRARLIIGLMLTAVQDGPNAALFAGGLPTGTPTAEKNGWRKSEQHGAGIAYTRRGPVIMVVLTQRAEGASLPDARAIGAEVARAATR